MGSSVQCGILFHRNNASSLKKLFSVVEKAMRLARALWGPEVGSHPIYHPRYFYHQVSHRTSTNVFGVDKQRFLPSVVPEIFTQFLQYTFLRLTHYITGHLSFVWTRIVDGADDIRRLHSNQSGDSRHARCKERQTKIHFQPLNGWRKSKGMLGWRSPQIINEKSGCSHWVSMVPSISYATFIFVILSLGYICFCTSCTLFLWTACQKPTPLFPPGHQVIHGQLLCF